MGGLFYTSSNMPEQPVENHDKPWWGQPVPGPKCDPKFPEYKTDSLPNTKQPLNHTFVIIRTTKAHVLNLNCSKIHVVNDKWCFGIQTAYKTGHYLYISAGFSCYPPNAMSYTSIYKTITFITQYVQHEYALFSPTCSAFTHHHHGVCTNMFNIQRIGYNYIIKTHCLIKISQPHVYNVCNTKTVYT